MREIKLSRFVFKEKQTDLITMHIFCDASETGYGACSYEVAAEEKGGRRPTLLPHKAKVAPLKAQSIPCLKFCEALLGSKVTKAVSKSLSELSLHNEQFYAWTDSTIVLGCRGAEANCWSTFVANGVAKIQEIDFLKWSHVERTTILLTLRQEVLIHRS